jgi:hypothetical protein
MIWISLLALLPMATMSHTDSEESAPKPAGYHLQAWAELRPSNDLLLGRIVNVSKKPQPVSMESLNPGRFEFCGMIVPSSSSGSTPVPNPQKRKAAKPEKVSTVIKDDGPAQWFSSGGVGRGAERTFDLAPNQYIGTVSRFSKSRLFSETQKALSQPNPHSQWRIWFGGIPYQDQASQAEQNEPMVVLTSNALGMDSDTLKTLIKARDEINNNEANRKSNAPNSIADSAKTSDRFELMIGLLQGSDKLMVDLACVNARPLRVEQISAATQPVWVGPGETVDRATLNPALLRWSLEADHKVLFDNGRGGSTTKAPDRQVNDPIVINTGQLVGQWYEVHELPFVTAVRRFFADNTNPKAVCHLKLKMQVLVPGPDGKPRLDGELLSNEIAIDRTVFNKVIGTPAPSAKEK